MSDDENHMQFTMKFGNSVYLTGLVALMAVPLIGLAQSSGSAPESDTNSLRSSLQQTVEQLSPEQREKLSAFRSALQLETSTIAVPTVISYSLPTSYIEHKSFAVLEADNGTFQPVRFSQERDRDPIAVEASAEPLGPSDNAGELVDDNANTSITFRLQDSGVSTATIALNAAEPITSEEVYLQLAPHVAYPAAVTIWKDDKRPENIVARTEEVRSSRITFPRTTARTWHIEFTYTQPLRISELRLAQEGESAIRSQELRFLARPDTVYYVFTGADREVTFKTTESGNLAGTDEVVAASQVGFFGTISNPLYAPADIDGDGVFDRQDNCVETPNPDQVDANNNGKGDACEDFDRDGIVTAEDNCPQHPNRDQADADGDGIGDACDNREDRITERNPWLPWVALGLAAMVIIGLLIITRRSMREAEQQNTDTPHEQNGSSEHGDHNEPQESAGEEYGHDDSAHADPDAPDDGQRHG
jgi:hypothetical protein